MAGADGLMIMLVGFLILLGSVAPAAYALAAGKPRRGFFVGIIAIVGAMVGNTLCLPLWIFFVRGTGSRGERIVYPEDWPLAAMVVFEGAALVAAIAGTIRQHMRRRREAHQ